MERDGETSGHDFRPRRVVRGGHRKRIRRQRPGKLRQRHSDHRQLPSRSVR